MSLQVFLRVKSTVTERGRIVNLKQAGYVFIKIRGRTVGESSCCHFLGLAWLTGPCRRAGKEPGMFDTVHGMDMRIVQSDDW